MLRRFYKVFLIVVILMILWVGVIEPNSIVINKKTIELSNWHKEHNNYKIAVLSDFHISYPYITEQKVKKIVEMTNAQNPDLILLLGDYVYADGISYFYVSKKVRNKNLFDSLKQLRGLKKPVIAILGNHDWVFGGELIAKTLQKEGITVLEEQYVKVSKNGKDIIIGGLPDLWGGRWDGKQEVEPFIKKIKSNDPLILLSHNPDVFPHIPQRAELTFSGHTHGGQLNIPFIRNFLIPSDYGGRYAKGLIKENNHFIFVTSGIGTTYLPLRFLDLPEIVIIELKQKSK